MSSQDKHMIPWSPADVQKYLKGELSAREMHHLEKAALEDPFLADAIEGLSQRPTAPLAGDLDELQSRLDARISEKKKRPLGWMKMAAAIVLLLGLGYTAWFTLIDHRNSDIAKFASAPTAPPASARSTTPASPTTQPPGTNSTSADTVSSSQPDKTTSALVKTERPEANITSTLISAPKAKSPVRNAETFENAAASKATVDSISMLNTRVAGLDVSPIPMQINRIVPDTLEFRKQTLRSITEGDQMAKKFDSRSADRRIDGGWVNQNVVYNGQVLDRNNRPLAGAYLQVSGPSNAITTTNALGQFKLNLRPQDTTQQLTVALIGYQNASLAVNKLNSDDAIGNTIFLKENPNVLSEVVVTREGRSEAFATAPFEDKTEKLDSFWIKVAPVTGRLAYLDYIQTAKKGLPVDTTIQGAEVVSFGIDRKGTPIDFKIEHSLSPAHDAGVIRLITDGARWKILKGKNVRAMVNVSFP